MNQDKGLVDSLMDMSFQSFVTPKIVKLLYILMILASALGALSVLGSGLFSGKFFGMVGGVVGAPIVFVVGVLVARVYMEILIVVFKIAENTSEMARRGKEM